MSLPLQPMAIIGAALAVTGAVLYMHHRLTRRDGRQEPVAAPEPEECCGQHSVCEKFAPPSTNEADYYDDDELDAYAARTADGYTEAEVEQFREVLLTLQPNEIVPWTRALERRGINLPTALRDELLLLLS